MASMISIFERAEQAFGLLIENSRIPGASSTISKEARAQTRFNCSVLWGKSRREHVVLIPKLLDEEFEVDDEEDMTADNERLV